MEEIAIEKTKTAFLLRIAERLVFLSLFFKEQYFYVSQH